MKNIKLKDTALVVLILFAALSRMVPHPFNFTPITAIALFGGAYFTKKYLAFVVPAVALLIGDIWLQYTGQEGFHAGTPLIYLTFGLITLMSFFTLKNVSFASVVGSTFLGAIIFYLITNFSYFYDTSLYPHNLNGVVASYTAALPFFKNSLAGDMFYSGLLFGSYYVIKQGSKVFQGA